VTWICVAFGAGVSLGGALWSTAAIEYRRRWREAVEIMRRMDDERSLPYAKPWGGRPSLADRQKLEAIISRHKKEKRAA
jgi:hypothetical protein